MRFTQWLQLNEQPLGAAPGGTDMGGAPPPGGAGAAPPPTGGPPMPPMGGGGMGGLGGPAPPMGGAGGGGAPAGGPPIKPKSYDVWSVLEELLDKKSHKNTPSKEKENLVQPKSLRS